jgi:uncharacterized membrane protein YbaN (DUF454 family)
VNLYISTTLSSIGLLLPLLPLVSFPQTKLTPWKKGS